MPYSTIGCVIVTHIMKFGPKYVTLTRLMFFCFCGLFVLLFVVYTVVFIVVFIETKTNDLVVIDLNTRVHAISLWYFSVVIKDCLRRTSPVKFYRK